MNSLSISQILKNIWAALRGAGGAGAGMDFIVVYDSLGAILFAFLLFKVFLTEGLHVAMGARTELPRILVKYLFVAAMFAVWPRAADALFAAVTSLADLFYPSLDTLLQGMNTPMTALTTTNQAATNTQGLTETILGGLYNFTIGNLLILVGTIVLFLCYALVLVNIAGSLTILAMNLVLGPVFFALAFDKDFRVHSHKWFSTVLSYFLLIPLYGAALAVAAQLLGTSLPANWFGLPSGPQMMAQLIGPIMSVGVVFSTNRIVNSLVGGAAGAGAGSMVLGLAGVGAHLIPGGAVLRSTAAGGRAAVGAAASAARSVGSRLSATARAALGR
ncbi:MAG: type IV secretion system protein [Acidobacteria bacterium]|nr:type IV secretion system protein [Acidobacteriota bacterium]MCI0721329.1 type IV secretion system protein [Acidobacteriota bacterium]